MSVQTEPPAFDPEDYAAFERAVALLESSRFLVRVSAMLGKPIEKLIQTLPDPVANAVGTATASALEAAAAAATRLMRESHTQPSWDWSHKLVAAGAGGLGGWFGFAGAAVELPFTTVLMLRSIIDIARSEGHDINSAETIVEAINVFALSGPSSDDDEVDATYFAVRAGLAALGKKAAAYLATKKGQQKAGEYAAKMSAYLAKIGGRYAPIVGDKFAAQSVPVVGAIGGALINGVFMDHFQDQARGHFIVLRLEGKYGADAVRFEYEAIRARLKAKRKPRKKGKR